MNARCSPLAVSTMIALAAAAAGAETIEGRVELAGKPPPAAKVDRDSDPYCARTQATEQTVLVSGNRLQNVWVRISKGARDQPGSADRIIEITQRHCTYEPHVVAMQAGNTLVIRNEDPVLHNVHAYFGESTAFNKAMEGSEGKPASPVRLAASSKPSTAEWDGVMKWKCDVHPWMSAFVAVARNPYFATTGTTGEFRIEGVPPGRYTLAAWHEKYGEALSEVTVEAGKTAQVSFRFEAAEKTARRK